MAMMAKYDLHLYSVEWRWNRTTHLLTGSFVLSAINDRSIDIQEIYYLAHALELSDDEGQHGRGWVFKRVNASDPPLRLDAHANRSFSVTMQFRANGPTPEHVQVGIGAFYTAAPVKTGRGSIEYQDSCLRIMGDRLVYDVDDALEGCNYRRVLADYLRLPASTISFHPPQEPTDDEHAYLAPPFDREFWEPICDCFV